VDGLTTTKDDEEYERYVEKPTAEDPAVEETTGVEDVMTENVMFEEVGKTYCEDVAGTDVLEPFVVKDVELPRLEAADMLRDVEGIADVLGKTEVAERFSGAGTGIAISKALS